MPCLTGDAPLCNMWMFNSAPVAVTNVRLMVPQQAFEMDHYQHALSSRITH
jgi:hypothetical protein